jgi:branched-subunit amino acid aminotransferase/4-amino-4-deoxychorismate lyase
LRIKLEIDLETARAAVTSLLESNARRNGRLRITALKEETGTWRVGVGSASRVLMFSADEMQGGTPEVAITISPYRLLSTRLLAGVKQTSMLEHLLAFEEARSRGFDEAIMLNERGEIVGATAANLFWVEGDEVYTPSLATGCVAGVTRRVVHQLAEKWKLHVVEGGFTVKRLLDAREVFLTSTQREIAIVKSFDATEYQMKEARISNLLARKLREVISGEGIN